jgi:DNA-binding CsgD family transcriptional regulator
MKGCANCGKRDNCRALCERIEGLLPKELTGKDTHREVALDADDFASVVEMHSYARWCGESRRKKSAAVDLSGLTGRERRAVMLLASGLSQREAAARMRITRYALRSLVARGLRKARVAHLAHLVRDGC